ncbi:MAG: hypothetical protein AB7P69_27080 [Candidatus Binatia bacterium]
MHHKFADDQEVADIAGILSRRRGQSGKVALDLVCRVRDPRDRRNMLVRRTAAGMAFYQTLEAIITTAASQRGTAPDAPPIATISSEDPSGAELS